MSRGARLGMEQTANLLAKAKGEFDSPSRVHFRNVYEGDGKQWVGNIFYSYEMANESASTTLRLFGHRRIGLLRVTPCLSQAQD